MALGKCTCQTLTLVQEYFTRFGYVMDVYMPRDKSNRAEHRGFAFVTLETEAAVARAKTHGQHQIRRAMRKFVISLHCVASLQQVCQFKTP